MPDIQAKQQPVTQITIVESQPDKQAEVLSLMTERARFMARQPGFISISLHRSLMASGSSTTSNGRIATFCNQRTARRSSARSGATSIN